MGSVLVLGHPGGLYPAEKTLQFVAETMSVLWMVRGTARNLYLILNELLWYFSLPAGLPD